MFWSYLLIGICMYDSIFTTIFGVFIVAGNLKPVYVLVVNISERTHRSFVLIGSEIATVN